jgi:hypothetical protein
MASILKEVDGPEFEANLVECGDHLKEVVAYLRSTAEHTGSDVTPRRYKHPKPNKGWGITFYAREEWFCQFHPKRHSGHVGALILGATADELKAAGLVPNEKRGDGQLWVSVKSMREAVRLVPLILRAHDRRAPRGATG